MQRAKFISAWVDSQVASKTLPFAHVTVIKDGEVVFDHLNAGNSGNTQDSIYRIYSMTKPVVSLALLMLYERGLVLLSDPAWKYLGPKWKKQNMRVVDLEATKRAGGGGGELVTKPCLRTITLHHLLTHTSGLSHGLTPPELGHAVDAHYSKNGLSAGEVLLNPSKVFANSQEFCDALAQAPLSFQPGQAWQYSWGVELLGRIVEVVSGQTLEDFCQENLFAKLGMSDTSFFLPASKQARLSKMYLPTPEKSFREKKRASEMLRYCSGSGGLFSTTADYCKFCDMLANSGALRKTGEQIISPHVLAWATSNHLRDPKTGLSSTVREMGICEISKETPPGIGFGLGFAVTQDGRYDGYVTFPGEFYWSGAASTHFFVNPALGLGVVFCTQLLTPLVRDVPISAQLHAVVYGSMSKM